MTFPILVLVTEYQLDFCCVAVINVQLYASNEARIIGCQKERSSSNLQRLAYSTHWEYRGEAVLHFLRRVSNITISANVDVNVSSKLFSVMGSGGLLSSPTPALRRAIQLYTLNLQTQIDDVSSKSPSQ